MTTALDNLRTSVITAFPWLAHVTTASDGGLSLRAAAAKLLHIGGDALDPAAARVGDFVVRLYRDSNLGVLWASASPSAPYVWAPVASGIIPPTVADAGTAVRIVTGSQKVTCG